MNHSSTLPATTCSHSSLASGEQLFGTASNVDTWILIEYPHPYGEKALPESGLSTAVKAHLKETEKSHPGTKILLIRRHAFQPSNHKVFIAVSHLSIPVCYELNLENYDDLVNLDFHKFTSEHADGQAYIREDPLFLVCTNGKRDPCCALHGVPVYEKLSHLLPESTWQSSHVGGHRFAANVISLPHGILYGRMRAEHINQLYAAQLEDRLLIDHYRGRSSFTPEAQAAEFYLRTITREMHLDTFKLIHREQVEENRWDIRFDTAQGSEQYHLIISEKQSNFEVMDSCSKPDIFSTKSQYFMTDFHIVSG